MKVYPNLELGIWNRNSLLPRTKTLMGESAKLQIPSSQFRNLSVTKTIKQ
ncbi:hypothetical protein NIES4106_06810 [Fischerella sp. NIES-4106]|jgi:hypothetical protein|nr:hypothetical protein NIES4106_06810 [Fischerella sp. NIES-4106]